MDSAVNFDAIGSIAIIGMSGRFPGAKNLDEFWQNLRDGVESISFFSEQELIDAGIDPAMVCHPNYVKAGAVLEDVDLFDASFFGLSNREASVMDPQHRLFMECAWEALESAGYTSETYDGKIGVYAGTVMSSYLLSNLYLNFDLTGGNDILQTVIGNDKDYLATRLSYKLNLKGPSITVQSSCSTSLVAICQAYQSLLNYQCDMALAGGVSIRVPLKAGYFSEKGSIFSPDGHCRTFDARAQGTIFGSGLGVVVLKRLADAIADGDDIHAVIKGCAINNDGALKVGYTAPGLDGQAEVIAMAQALAGVEPETITYVETHGTGTPIGDPIEVAALTQVFRASTEKKGFCALGSVKSNFGHLEAAAGVTGLIKTVLALKHKLIPPSINFEEPNPQIDFASSPFYVNTKLKQWQTDGFPCRAGVSSFGIGGTNAHVVLEEAPKRNPKPVEVERPVHLLCLSAKNEKALTELAQRFESHLVANQSISLGDLCFTANTGRSHFTHRLAVVAESPAKMRERLAAFTARQETSGVFSQQVLSSSQPKIAFLFTGQGSQYVNMGRQLYDTQATFRNILDKCDIILRPLLKQSLLSVLYPKSGVTSLLDQTAYTQPALFALEYALVELLRSWGIKPSVVMGHSLGEYVAACVAGVFSLEDALKLVVERSCLMQSLPQDGEMAVVFASHAQVLAAVQPYVQDVAIAAVNGPQNIVISGKREAVNEAIATLQAQGVKTKNLKVSHAFHSPLMQPILPTFEQFTKKITYSCPHIDIISNLSGEIARREIATPEYWCSHILQTVKFADSMETLDQQGCEIFIEIGPKPTLLGMGRQCLPEGVGVWLPSLRQGHSDWQQILQSLAELYVQGVKVDWFGFERDYSRYRFQLPTYPWQRSRYWLEKVHEKQQDQKLDVLYLWKSALSAGHYQSQQGPLDLALHTYSTKRQYLEHLATAYITEALFQLGAYKQPGESHSADSLIHHFKILSTYSQLLSRWLHQLANTGILKHRGEEIYVCDCPLPNSQVDFLLSEARKFFTDDTFLLNHLQNCGQQLADILTGKQAPSETLFPGGSFDVAENFYQKWAAARYFNGITRSIIESVLKALSLHKHLRILEIGAGVGGTTASVLPILSPEKTIYHFTDVSKFLLIQAKEKFKSYPFVHYGLLDIEQNPQNFGYEYQSFDVVVVTNVLYGTRNLGKTIEHILSLLAPGGLLLLNEVTHHSFWLEICTGLMESWQGFDDPLRQGKPLLSEKQWEEALLSHGFEKVKAFPEPGSVAEILGQHILVAQVPVYVAHPNNSTIPAMADQKSSTSYTALHTPEPSLIRKELLDASSQERQRLLKFYLDKQLAKVLGLSDSALDKKHSLKNLGLDSLMAIVLKNRIETDLGITVPIENFLQDISFGQLAIQILEQLTATPSTSNAAESSVLETAFKHSVLLSKSPLVEIQPIGSKLPFVCVHPGGLDVSIYANLARHLTHEQPFYTLQPPELDNYRDLNKELLSSITIEEIADQCIEALKSFQPKGPYLLGGWSLGGCVAFEMAYQLCKQGDEVALLALLDVTNITDFPLDEDCALISGFASYLGARYNRALTLSNDNLQRLDLNEQLRHVLKQSIMAGVLSPNTDLSEIRHIFQIYKAGAQTSLRRVQNYRPQIYPNRITLFQASEALDGLSGVVRESILNRRNWSQLSTKPLDLHVVPGNHYTMLVEPHVQILAQKLKFCLDQVEASEKK
ncbi:polyketide synthase (plasmid) [Brasilonema octagenarum UFV-E1]|uniref:Polyketide synthase n=2 Tax=Brasilonema TaxID=383614 RepID=A0A856MQ19_9CYAN|nr:MULTISPECIES: type I polyketide synthase [Brasilonema]NMF62568.1 polyketide synthase [Brasilonema octagenarum UFV-OR1]QDL12652.1 polyketide synthase [Brasilonema sennae CENA114]QDL19046.1 polyketide synthase [Brasilonema octagenarum UFV-E1]